MARNPIIREPRPKVPPRRRLAQLEERLAHDLLDDE
jgi:hypothetical protein